MPAVRTSASTTPATTEVTEVTDKQAAEQLRVLYASAPGLRKERNKAFKDLSENKVFPILAHMSMDEATNRLTATLDEAKVTYIQWSEKVHAFMLTLRSIGESNPNASIRIVTKSGRPRSVNGEALWSAFAREEAEILGGTLA